MSRFLATTSSLLAPSHCKFLCTTGQCCLNFSPLNVTKKKESVFLQSIKTVNLFVYFRTFIESLKKFGYEMILLGANGVIILK